MDRNFARALALVLKSEGGWSDNPADPGGATMKGVTLANFRRYVKADATKADLQQDQRRAGGDRLSPLLLGRGAGAELPDGVDYAVFDFAVNSGPGRAAKYLQAAVGAAQDGRIGPATLKAAGARPPGTVIDDLCDARLAFLRRLPTWPVFGKGWSDRVRSVRAQALKMTVRAQAVAPAPATPAQSPSPAPARASAPQPELHHDNAPQTDDPKPAGIGKPAAAAGIVVLAAAAVANWWHELTAWVHSFF